MIDPVEDLAANRIRLDGSGIVPEEEILRLVAQRQSFRQARRFAESDAIREELRSMGIELYDKEKEWRSRDGRRGMLFTAGPIECTLADEVIQEMIRDREEARRGKDFARADMVRDELRNHGVELDDKEAIWRTAGGRMGTYTGGPQPPVINGETIRQLVAERERLRAQQNFEAADELRRQLSTLGVEIFDNERVWRTRDGQQGVIITGGHEDTSVVLSNADILLSIAQREEARAAKNFPQADAIRDELRQHGVELLDNQKAWTTTDGRQGTFSGAPLQQTAQAVPTGFGVGDIVVTQSPPGGIQAQMAAGLAALLVSPAQHRANAASAMAQQAQQLASLPSSPVTQSPSGATFSTASVVALVNGRERARERHDWDAADNIRADMRSHGIDVWDKEKVWRANDGRSGPISQAVGSML